MQAWRMVWWTHCSCFLYAVLSLTIHPPDFLLFCLSLLSLHCRLPPLLCLSLKCQCFLGFCLGSLLSFFFFWPCHAACGTLVSQPGIEPRPPAVEAWGFDQWTTREVPLCLAYSTLSLDYPIIPGISESLHGNDSQRYISSLA